MMCQAIHSWTFSELVGAFLDLSIAFFLLCASSIAFFVSKFLGLFGLGLPCPCDGLFGYPRNSCLQRRLVDSPFEKISSVQTSLKSRFPFDSILPEYHNGTSNVKLVNEGRHESEHGDLDGGASSSSFLEKRLRYLPARGSVASIEQSLSFGVENSASEKEGQFDIKGKGVESWRPRHGLRRRQKGVSVNNGNRLAVSSYDTLQSDAGDIPQSPSSISKWRNEVTEVPASYGDGEEATTDVNLQERFSRCLELDDSVDENKSVEIDELPAEGVRYKQKNLGFDKDENNMIRVLEQALEEGYAARDALYLELEKERSAAATAADEAMAMILRLQEEKASIEMEARQYQRMIEEKYAYDAEEMSILKEILVRREREKHFLEKEVEEYRQIIFGNDRMDSGMDDLDAMQERMTSSYSCKEPTFILPQIHNSIEKPYEVSSIETQNRTLAFEKKIPVLELDQDSGSLKQEDVYDYPSVDSRVHLSGKKEVNYEFQEKDVISMDDSKISDISNENEQDRESENPPSLFLDTESCVYDVHVIDDENILHNKLGVDRKEQLSLSTNLSVPIRCDSPKPLSRAETEYDKNGSSSCATSGLPPRGSSSGKALLTDLRRNSMSAIDYERVKIDNEVEWLRERLRIVQEGREKLSFSVEHKEREKIQLQLLEDIANQLREIRQLTEPGKAVRQASLPPPSSKVTSKKRRWRSASLGVHRSS